jgi:hypothetical protein
MNNKFKLHNAYLIIGVYKAPWPISIESQMA